MFRKRIKHPNAPDLYLFHHGRSVNNGAMEFAFEPAFTLPLLTFVGLGTRCGSMVGNPAPAYIGRRAPVAGLGGLQYAQMFYQPLVETPFGNGE